MRNWNFYQQIPSSDVVQFWAYLWGIETNVYFLSLSIKELVLSLPMRNWNKGSDSYVILSAAGFEPTYEELKLKFQFFR